MLRTCARVCAPTVLQIKPETHFQACRLCKQRISGICSLAVRQQQVDSQFDRKLEPSSNGHVSGDGPVREDMNDLTQLLKGGTKLTKAAQLLWAHIVQPGDYVIDATCGNGIDTLWLCKAVGSSGRVLAIDVQEDAIQSTKQLLANSLAPDAWPKVDFAQMCHSEADLWSGEASLVCFNLGYLPGGDKMNITKPETTRTALQNALKILKRGGALSVMTYIGHEGGPEEHENVMNLLTELPTNEWIVLSTKIINRPKSPYLNLAIRTFV